MNNPLALACKQGHFETVLEFDEDIVNVPVVSDHHFFVTELSVNGYCLTKDHVLC